MKTRWPVTAVLAVVLAAVWVCGEEGAGAGKQGRARCSPPPPILAADGAPARWWAGGLEAPPLPERRTEAAEGEWAE